MKSSPGESSPEKLSPEKPSRGRRSFSAWLGTWTQACRVWWRIIKLLRPHWVESVGAVVSLLLSTAFALIVPAVLAWAVDQGLSSGRAQDLLLAAGAVLVVSILRGIFAYMQGNLSQQTSVLVAYDLRNLMYEHLQRLSFSYHDENETGQLMSRLTADIEAVRNSIPLGILRVFNTVVMFGAITVILAVLDWRLALITLLAVPVLLVLATDVAKKLRPMWTGVQQSTGELSTVMQESLSGHRVVQAFAREEYEMGKFDTVNQQLRNYQLAALRLSARNQPLMILVLNIATVLVLWVGGAAVIGQAITIGTLVAVIQYALLLNTPVRQFGFMVNWMMRGVSAGVRLFEVLDTEPAITDKPHAVTLHRVAGHVRFEDVSFAYGSGPAVLHDISIDAKPGQAIALLGATGSGKSTILQLLPRFYDVSAGRITVDGHEGMVDVRDVTQHSLRRNIGFVLQDVFLFNATLRDNIAFGSPGATDEQILEAARIARVDDFVHILPDGYETWVGERGVTLSGGQKQRVAIARTLLMNPRILILDDSTSSVDMETEYLIQEALAAVMKGRTTFVVASRLRTVKSADQILVLDKGRIIERGTHETLLPLGGAYTRLYDAQLREQEAFEQQFFSTRGAGEVTAEVAENAEQTQRSEPETRGCRRGAEVAKQ